MKQRSQTSATSGSNRIKKGTLKGFYSRYTRQAENDDTDDSDSDEYDSEEYEYEYEGDSDYDYGDYQNYEDYQRQNENFNPFDQFVNISENDYFTFYEKSKLPDFSDFRLATFFTQNEMKYNGYQKNDFIVQCTFDGKKCGATWFKTYQDPYYGNCFTFNSIRDRNLSNPVFIRSSAKTGQEYGLKLTLFFDVEEYIGLLGQNAGGRVLVFDPETEGHVRSQSSAVGAGTITFISIRSAKLILQHYTVINKCIIICDKIHDIDKNMFWEIFFMQPRVTRTCR